MGKKIMKMGLIAAMTMGAVSGAHAASQASIDFTGKIVKTACDITLQNSSDSNISLGVFAATEFVDTNTVHTAHGAPIMLNTGNCAGADLPATESIKLVATQSNGAIPATLSSEGLWGNTDPGVGISLKGATYSGTGTLPANFDVIAPNTGLVLYTNNTAQPENVSGKLPKSVVLKAGLRAHVVPGEIQSGDIKSSIVFTAAYE